MLLVTVVLKTTTELNIITVVTPVYMTHYYVPGNGEITSEKEKRKLPKVKWECYVLPLIAETIRQSELLHIQCNEIKQNKQYKF